MGDPEHITAMSKGYRILKVGETITGECLAWLEKYKEWHNTRLEGKKVKYGTYCCPVDVQKTSDNADRGETVSDKEYHGGFATPEERDRLLSRIAELERKNELLIHAIEANPSKAKVAELERERDDYRSQIIEIEKAHDALCDATKGYTLENITTFIEAMPPAEDLEGYEVEYRYPRIGDSAWLNHELRWKVVEKEQRCGISAIVRTPIIEYIPTEDITDALARDRVVCDVRYSCKTQWIPAVLLVVDGRPEKSVKYLVQLIASEDFVWFQVDHCRIRKDTIERLRGKK